MIVSKNKNKKNNDDNKNHRRTMKNTNGRKQKPGMRYLLLKRGQHIPTTKLRNQYH